MVDPRIQHPDSQDKETTLCVADNKRKLADWDSSCRALALAREGP
jgi:hypothetical protein